MASRRSRYAGFNSRLYRLKDWISAEHDTIVEKTPEWTGTQTAALDALNAALATAAAVFPRRQGNP